MTKMPITPRKPVAKKPAPGAAAARAPRPAAKTKVLKTLRAPKVAGKAARPQASAAAPAKKRGTQAVKDSAARVARAAAKAATAGTKGAKAEVRQQAVRPAKPGARKAPARPAKPGAPKAPARSAKPGAPKAARPAKPGAEKVAARPVKAEAERVAAPPAEPEARAAPARFDAEPPADAEAPPAPPRSEAETDAPPAPKRRLAPRPRLEAWAPRPLPAPRFGRAEDPRLAAAIAARERWHGRSGRPALKSGTQAVAFARERRLVQLTEPTALPNLLDPIVGKACLPAERSEGPTAATFAGWRKEVVAAHDLLELRLAFERPTLAQAELWPSIVAMATPLEEAARDGSLPLPREAEEALEILDRKGTVPVERLRSLLGLRPEEMAHLKGQLEARFLVLARGEIDDDDGPIVVLEPFGRWAARAVGPRRIEPHQAFTVLFAAAMRSAVVLWPEEIAHLFPWSAAERDAAVAACVQAGAVVTYDEGGSVACVASPVPR